VSYPSCYRYWLEQETAPGTWTAIDFKAGHSTLEAVAERLQDLRAAGETGRYRVVDPDGKEILEESAPASELR
jgi:hypothetical protein